MQTVHRQIGRFRGKTGPDKAQVIALIKDYEDVDNAIGQIIEDAKNLQQAWHDIAVFQTAIAKNYQELYDPIVGTSEEDGRPMAATPTPILSRTCGLHDVYSALQDELAPEIACIGSQVLVPATDAKNMIQGFKPIIKKRDNKRLDCDRVQDKVFKQKRKLSRSHKEETQLGKSQAELEVLTEEFESLDAHLREYLTPVVRAAFSLIPPLLAAHISIQNRLLGLSYTVLHEYCVEHGFPSPPPDMDAVVASWNAAFHPTLQIVEGFAIVRKHPALQRKPEADRPGLRRPKSSRTLAAPQYTPEPLPSPYPSPPAETPKIRAQASAPQLKRKPSGITVPTDFTTATIFQGRRNTPGLSSQGDYFSQAVAAKKKPPPPPPGSKPKPRAEYVVAEYDFTGGVGELSFSEGDMIKIIHKTATDQDWWDGELNNIRGYFPANYCKPA